ncbi:hypothetical protein PCASD_22041 [Puccinia coronata f. sp. avenae]|uniref:Uncharacterized protein n=1 Tax=Puccinia coronata f. sp. avenae TaxID=200324 RepID=A0A2N5T087_9BASI|nr:hypothetical protein PCASD_22041 [Puccinia coronata f. sp. avenae]
MSAGPTDTLEQRNNVSVGPADVTSVYKTDVTSVAATDLAAGGCNRYNPFGGATADHLGNQTQSPVTICGIASVSRLVEVQATNKPSIVHKHLILRHQIGG